MKSFILSLLSSAFSVFSFAQYSPQQDFKGTIGKTLSESKPEKIKYNPEAPKNAPNVIYILLDDVGFGVTSAFGGLVKTPHFDSLANNGLRYTNFHTTAMCSPTRASLLTGRNAHSVHMGFLIDGAADFPGYDAHMPFEKGTAAEILKENGYNTLAVGKWHLTAYEDLTQAGPFNRWPTGRGFEHYYGFMAGETDEYYPQLWENTAKIEPLKQGTILTTLLIDKAIKYIADQKSGGSQKPFFLYLTPGATHAPHQADQQWIDLYKGKFDGGWDKYREQVIANQIKLGIIPPDAVLPPLNKEIKPWDSLTANERKLFPRFMEAYAGYMSQTDYEIGRLINYLREINQLDNTIIFLMLGDNGASKEGDLEGYTGGVPEMVSRTLFKETDTLQVKNMIQQINEIGTIESSVNYPMGWALAANTPFQYWKTDANSEGGTRNPLILFYPNGIKEKGGIRNQYSHISDVLPTTIELTGVQVPELINGYKQDSLEGTSFAYSIAHPDAADKHVLQYYELFGSRSIYKDGWKAAVYHEKSKPFSTDVWALYNMKSDFNERHDSSAAYPDKLKSLQALFNTEAVKYNVYPIRGDRSLYDIASFFKKSGPVVLYNGASQLPTSSVPRMYLKSFTITSDVEINSLQNEGVLFAIGGRFNGLSLFIKDHKIIVAHNIDKNLTYLQSPEVVAKGKALIRYEFNYTFNPGADTAGIEILYINDRKVAEGPLMKKEGLVFEYDEGLDIGRDNQSAVSPLYKPPFSFDGILNKVTIDYK